MVYDLGIIKRQKAMASPIAAAGGVITKIKGFSKEKIGNCTQEPGGSSPKYARPCEDGC